MENYPSKWLAVCFGIFFGALGIHKFYIKDYKNGTIMLLLTILLSWTIFVPFLVMVVGFLEGLSFAFYNEKNWKILCKRFDPMLI